MEIFFYSKKTFPGISFLRYIKDTINEEFQIKVIFGFILNNQC